MQIRATYIEVTDFIARSGGTYLRLDVETCRDIIDALIEGRYRITRDTDNSITSFTAWWRIYAKDIELVKSGGRPSDLSNGDIIYIADHAGYSSCRDLLRFIRTITDQGCWHHRYKQPGQFRFYRKREVVNV